MTTPQQLTGPARQTADHAAGSPRRNRSPWTRAMSRLRSGALDHQLAAGCAADSGPQIATRAQQLTSSPYRHELAGCWHRLLDQVHRSATGRTTRVPLCRERVLAADREIEALVDALTTSQHPAARGVAMASVLLSDGLGPLYNRRNPADLNGLLSEVTRAI